MERIIPSLLQIKAVAILDAALRSTLDAKGESPSRRGFRNDLHGRIEAAVACGALPDATALHLARGSRNDVAHEFNRQVDWAELDFDIDSIQAALEHLNVVGPKPVLEIYAERVPKLELSAENAVIGFDYLVAVRSGESSVSEMRWSQEFLGLGD